MDDAQSERTLLAGLVAHRTGLVGRDPLLASLRAWILRKGDPLERVFVAEGILTEASLVPVSAAIQQVLSDHGGDPRLGLSRFGPIGLLRQDVERLGDPDLLRALGHVEPDANGTLDPYATLADPGRSVAMPSGPPSESADWATLATASGLPPETPSPSLEATFDPGVTQPLLSGSATLPGGKTAALDPDLTQAAPSRGSRSSVFPLPVNDPFQTQAFSEGPPTLASGEGSIGGSAPTRPARASGPSRFQILRPHAKGGLGEVFVARDEELNREVALKEIQGKHADHEESRLRFLVEAEVTGGLEHPGIVPVYGLGHYPDGRPYYAMRFIRGDSLKEAIDRFHKGDTDVGRDPGRRDVELRELLGRFVDVCLAMEYAHSRGVIHRDLKPANVMLGAFGETLVVDWGLAKYQDAPESVDSETSSRYLRPMSANTASSATIYGSAIGTPHFMSPEQAEGKLDQMGPPSDIYSLGATLYYLLTGVTPFQDRKILDLLKKVKAGDFPAPSLVSRRVPAPLNAICLKAMSRDPALRYESARALARDIQLWLADEPIACYREPLPVRFRRWSKRHRTLVTSVAVLFISGVVLLSGFTVLIRAEKARTDNYYRLARGAVDQMLTELGEVDLADIPQMEPVRKEMLTKAKVFYTKFLQDSRNDRGLSFETGEASLRLGNIVEMLGEDANAEKEYTQAITIFSGLLAGDAKNPQYRQALSRAHHARGLLLKRRNRLKDSEQDLKEALRLREGLAREFPGDLEHQKDLNDTRYHLGAVLARLAGRLDEADSLYDKAIASQNELLAAHPDDVDLRRKLARYLNNTGILLRSRSTLPVKAETVFRKVVQIEQKLVDDSPKTALYRYELVRYLVNLAATLETLGDRVAGEESSRKYWKEAKGYDEKAVAIAQSLADDFPRVPDYQNNLSATLSNLGQFLVKIGDTKGGMERLDKAYAVQLEICQKHPDRHDYRYQLSSILIGRALVLLMTGSSTFAEKQLRANAKEMGGLVGKHPELFRYRWELGRSLSRLAQLMSSQDRLKEAAEIIPKAIEQERLASAADPENRDYHRELLIDLQVQAEVLAGLRRYDDSIAAAESWPATIGDDWEELVDAAQFLMLLQGKVSADETKAEDFRRRYGTLALKLLNDAFRNGFRNPQRLNNPDFDAIREWPEFRNLKDKIENAQPVVG